MDSTGTTLIVRKSDFHAHSVVPNTNLNTPSSPNQVLVRLSRFTLSANNVTYAALGNSPLRYYDFFPPAPPSDASTHFCLPVWGFADVVNSTIPGIALGTRLFGYFPVATYHVLNVRRSATNTDLLEETSEHRQALREFYQQYRVFHPERWAKHEDAFLALWVAYITAYVMTTRTLGNIAEDTTVVLVGAAAKTALCTAALLKHQKPVKVLGVCSQASSTLAKQSGFYDGVYTYDEFTGENTTAVIPANNNTIIIDFTSKGHVIDGICGSLQDESKLEAIFLVGFTDYKAAGTKNPKARRFSVLTEWATLVREESERDFAERFETSFLEFLEAGGVNGLRTVVCEGDAVTQRFDDLLDGKVSAEDSLIFRL